MITIIKPGKTKFSCTCTQCGCEFTYELEDISLSSFVICPTCGNYCYIGTNTSGTGIGWPKPGEAIPCNTPLETSLNPCADCDFWKKMNQPGFTYVGDTPCTWCANNPYKVTCGTTSYSSDAISVVVGSTEAYSGTIGTYTVDVDPVMNRYFSELATASNETNKADCKCQKSHLNSTKPFSNSKCCSEDKNAK